MEETEIKHEFDGRRHCRACLSIERTLRPLRELASTYVKLTSECVYPNQGYLESTLICWQCRSLLRKVFLFQEQVKRANELLQTNQSFIYGPLSNLTSVTLNETHQIIYIYEENIQTNTQSNEDDRNRSLKETSDNLLNENSKTYESEYESERDNLVSDNTENLVFKPQKRSKSRWSIKRAEENKKPKYKVCTNFNETFKKLQISNQELRECIEKEKSSEYYKSKRLKCYDCVLAFSNQKAMAEHQKLHSGNETFTCDICKSKVSDKRHLLSHLRKHYIVYKCVICQFVCRKAMRIWHFKKEHKKYFQCLKCKLSFGSRRDFFQHFKEWHEKFICDTCGTSFKMRYCIKDHIRKQHSPFECKTCNKKFSRYNGLWLHNRLVHRPASPAYCADCDTHYADTYRLKWHLCNSVKHVLRNKLRIPCSACEKVFTKKIYMTDHFNLVHLKVFKYRCETCDKNFVRNADLVKHKRKIHEGILPPKNKICYICGRAFTTNKILHNHVRTHTGERPFPCACGARFTQRAQRDAHARKHDAT